MNNELILSIVIPVYNASATIERVIASILKQSYLPHYEMLLIDDGSTDDSYEKLEMLARSNPKIVLTSQKNQKQAAARNNGMKQANGKFICFIDSDDYLKPNHFETLIKPLVENQRLQLTIAGIEKVSAKKKTIESVSAMSRSQTKMQVVMNYLTKNKEMDVGLWNKGFVTKIIKENNLTFQNANFFEDSLFVLEYLMVIQAQNILFQKQVTYELKKAENSTTTIFRKEIDQLSQSYMQAVTKTIQPLNLPVEVLTAFYWRTWLHVVHHHIKFDPNWTRQNQRNYLNKYKIPNKRKSNLALSYYLAIVVAKNYPTLYMKLYRK